MEGTEKILENKGVNAKELSMRNFKTLEEEFTCLGKEYRKMLVI